MGVKFEVEVGRGVGVGGRGDGEGNGIGRYNSGREEKWEMEWWEKMEVVEGRVGGSKSKCTCIAWNRSSGLVTK